MTTTLLLFYSFLQLGGAFFITPTHREFHSSTKVFLAFRGKIERPENEFSRPCPVDRILKGGKRDYSMNVKAEEEELNSLMNRFESDKILHLEADLLLRRERVTMKSSAKVLGIEVNGTITARLTRTCVRTGELFDVEEEMIFFVVARPISANSGGREDADELLSYEEQQQQTKQTGKKKKKRNKNPTMKDIDKMSTAELQNLLQDIDQEDDVVEDEGIYSLETGIFDVGELVAQTFWLKLDPFPKKPGSKPFQITISSDD
eukprot:CAMPEP_0194140034 /NCGR_PEP_ID=MMETSP0152-20130528/9639_1 /TAXON_ID=1049557 /ORGANISM="Thalassiothrix antarctica, Strain L6-D1" /LENGTH=260 /DNA_ID=CAMNT_0038838119 /DNA_START=29 /DNA_END=811 /DNA_ORIENTATION=+